MTLVSLDGRDDLVVRVERSFDRLSRQRVTRRPVTGASLGAAPERGAGARTTAPRQELCAVVAESRPDLASRLRRGLAARGVEAGPLATATEGRFTVVTTRLATAAHQELRALAAELGARVSSVGAVVESFAGPYARGSR